jgi:rRNA-processing protein Efg1
MQSPGQLEEGANMMRQARISHPANSQRSKKRYRMDPPTHKKQAHASSVHAVKKRIRDVKRRLERCPNLPANVRVEDERALAVHEQELATALEEKNRQKMIKRYHMVRFFGGSYLIKGVNFSAYIFQNDRKLPDSSRNCASYY